MIQYIPRNMLTVFALLCFVVVIHWLIFPYPSGLLHWHCGNLTIAPVPAKQPWWIWINTSCEFIMNDCITTAKQSTTNPVCIFLGIYCIWLSLEIIGIIGKNIDNGKLPIGVFLDSSKTVDALDHTISLDKLFYYGIKETELAWFKSYLTNRTQFVSYDGTNARTLSRTTGVTQRSISGPLLITIYMNLYS